MSPKPPQQNANQISYDDAVERLAQKFGVPKAVYSRMVGQESGGRDDAVSPKGASSRWQIMPATARGLGINAADPLEAAYGGLKILSDNYKQFRQHSNSERHAWAAAIAGYHGNPANVLRDFKAGGLGIPDQDDGGINTQDHVYKIIKDLRDEDFDRSPFGKVQPKQKQPATIKPPTRTAAAQSNAPELPTAPTEVFSADNPAIKNNARRPVTDAEIQAGLNRRDAIEHEPRDFYEQETDAIGRPVLTGRAISFEEQQAGLERRDAIEHGNEPITETNGATPPTGQPTAGRVRPRIVAQPVVPKTFNGQKVVKLRPKTVAAPLIEGDDAVLGEVTPEMIAAAEAELAQNLNQPIAAPTAAPIARQSTVGNNRQTGGVYPVQVDIADLKNNPNSQEEIFRRGYQQFVVNNPQFGLSDADVEQEIARRRNEGIGFFKDGNAFATEFKLATQKQKNAAYATGDNKFKSAIQSADVERMIRNRRTSDAITDDENDKRRLRLEIENDLRATNQQRAIPTEYGNDSDKMLSEDEITAETERRYQATLQNAPQGRAANIYQQRAEARSMSGIEYGANVANSAVQGVAGGFAATADAAAIGQAVVGRTLGYDTRAKDTTLGQASQAMRDSFQNSFKVHAGLSDDAGVVLGRAFGNVLPSIVFGGIGVGAGFGARGAQAIGGAFEGAQLASESYRTAIRNGATENQALLTAAIAAPIGAAVGGLSEKLLFSKLAGVQTLDRATRNQFSTTLIGELRRIAARGGKDFAEGAGVEYFEEAVQNTVSRLAAAGVYEKEPLTVEKVGAIFGAALKESLPALVVGGAVTTVAGQAAAESQSRPTAESDSSFETESTAPLNSDSLNNQPAAQQDIEARAADLQSNKQPQTNQQVTQNVQPETGLLSNENAPPPKQETDAAATKPERLDFDSSTAALQYFRENGLVKNQKILDDATGDIIFRLEDGTRYKFANAEQYQEGNGTRAEFVKLKSETPTNRTADPTRDQQQPTDAPQSIAADVQPPALIELGNDKLAVTSDGETVRTFNDTPNGRKRATRLLDNLKIEHDYDQTAGIDLFSRAETSNRQNGNPPSGDRFADREILERLDPSDLYEAAAATAYQRTGDGIELAPVHTEIMRRVNAVVSVENGLKSLDDDAPNGFFGQHSPKQNAFAAADKMREIAGRQTSPDKARFLRKFADDIFDTANRDGSLVVYTSEFPTVRRHELQHQASELGSRAAPLAERVDVAAAAERADFQIAREKLIAQGYKDDNAVLVEETMAHIVEGQRAEIGLTTEQALNFAEFWLKSFSDKGNDLNVAQFDRAAVETKGVLENVRREQTIDRSNSRASDAGRINAVNANDGSMENGWARSDAGAASQNGRNEQGQIADAGRPNHTENLNALDASSRRFAEEIADGDADFQSVLKTLAADPKGRAALEKTVAALTKNGRDPITRTITNVRRAGLITSLRTHLRNISSNVAFAGAEETARGIAYFADVAASKFTGERTVGFINPVAVAKSFKAVFKSDSVTRESGLSAAYRIMRHGDTKQNLDKQQLSEARTGSTILDAYVNTVFRSMAAEDALFKVYAFRRSVEEQAKTMALTASKTARINRRTHAERLLKYPTPEMIADASLYADYATFQSNNRISQSIEAAKNKTGEFGRFVAETVAPFDRTPTNIMLRALDYTPAGYVRAIYNAVDMIGGETTAAQTAKAQRLEFAERRNAKINERLTRWRTTDNVRRNNAIAENGVRITKLEDALIALDAKENLTPAEQSKQVALETELERLSSKGFEMMRRRDVLDKQRAFQDLTRAEQTELIETTIEKAFSRRDQREFAMNIGRASVGTAAMMIGYQLASIGYLAGILTTSGDSKEEVKKRAKTSVNAIKDDLFFNRKKAGVENGSLLIAGFGRIVISDSILGKALVLGATVYEQTHAPTAKNDKETDADKAWNELTTAKDIGWTLAAEQPLLHSVSDYYTRTPEDSAGAFVGSLVPSIVADAGEIMDDEPRKSTGFKNNALRRIPVAREQADKSTFVDKKERGDRTRRIIRAVDPFNTRGNLEPYIIDRPPTPERRKPQDYD